MDKILDPAVKSNGQVIESFYGLYSIYKILFNLLNDIKFGYGWRESTNTNAKLLKIHLQNLHAKETNIIAHGVGDFIAHWCITKIYTPKLNHKKFITLGTPFKSSIQAMGAILGVDDGGLQIISSLPQMHRLANGQHIFSIKELEFFKSYY